MKSSAVETPISGLLSLVPMRIFRLAKLGCLDSTCPRDRCLYVDVYIYRLCHDYVTSTMSTYIYRLSN